MSFRCGVEMVNTCEVPQSVNFSCTKSHIKGSLEKIGREYGFQPELPEREIELSVIKKSDFADLRHFWEPYIRLDVFCLAFIFAINSMEMQNKSGFGFKDC